MVEEKYCVYVTTYCGGKMPSKYVGSTKTEKIRSGYLGSVASKEFGEIWKEETKSNPNLFSVEIISFHKSRKKALEAELLFQKENDVVKSSEWLNKSLAKPNGFFGMDVSGEKNPMFGKSRKGEKHQGGENISSALKCFFEDEERSLNHRKNSSKMFSENNPASNPETMEKIKQKWKETGRNVGEKNGMFGKVGRLKGKKLFNNGVTTKAFIEGQQPEGWELGRHTK